jgi:hypothetical protein
MHRRHHEKAPSASQEEGPHQKPALLAPLPRLVAFRTVRSVVKTTQAVEFYYNSPSRLIK